jgi:hypothetical protein
MIVGYQWLEVRVLRGCDLPIPLYEHEQRSSAYANSLTQIEAVPPGRRTRAISGHTLFQLNQ